jgi:hypothetical protein
MLYRSSWVAKGANGNTHGYSIQTFAGSLPIDSVSLPADLATKFSSAELHLLETKLFQPARQAAQEKAREAEHLKSDPLWRLDEATRLTLEAAERSERGSVPNSRVAAVHAALAKVKTITQAPTHALAPAAPQSGAQVPVSIRCGTSPPVNRASGAGRPHPIVVPQRWRTEQAFRPKYKNKSIKAQLGSCGNRRV